MADTWSRLEVLTASVPDEAWDVLAQDSAERHDAIFESGRDSMVVMKDRGIRLVLTYDEHFEQEGLVALLRKDPKEASLYL